MALVVFQGETVRLWVKRLTHADDGLVATGATVTIRAYDPAGAQSGVDLTGLAAGAGNWYADFTVPSNATAGEWLYKATAVKGTATFKGREAFTVEAF